MNRTSSSLPDRAVRKENLHLQQKKSPSAVCGQEQPLSCCACRSDWPDHARQFALPTSQLLISNNQEKDEAKGAMRNVERDLLVGSEQGQALSIGMLCYWVGPVCEWVGPLC